MSIKDDLQIVLITYNRAVLLKRTLETIMGDDSPIRDFDITILDNHSTDETCDIVKQFAQNHQNLKYEKNIHNLGLNGNIIKAYLAGRKKYVWVLCDDDSYDFSHWDDVVAAIQNDEDYILVSRYALPDDHKDDPAHIFMQASFVPASIIKTSLITDAVARNMIETSETLFPHLNIIATMINTHKKICVMKHGIVDHGLEVELTDYSYTRGHNPKDLTKTVSHMTWTHGFSLILQQIKDRELQIRCFNAAIEQPDIFNGNWASFYNHIVKIYHEPQFWSAFYDVYAILDDQHGKELLNTLFSQYPEIKKTLEIKGGFVSTETICERISKLEITLPLKRPNFLERQRIRFLSHITFGKTKARYKAKWLKLKYK